MSLLTPTRPGSRTDTLITSAREDKVKVFTYKARRADQSEVTGTAKAEDRADVNRELQSRGLVPLEIKEARRFSDAAGFRFRRHAKHREVALTIRQLAAMYDAGLSYVEGLEVAESRCDDKVLRPALGEVRVAVAGGTGFADALREHPAAFPPMLVNMAAAGEKAGTLKDAMTQAADQLEAEDAMRQKVIKASVHPAIVLGIALVIFLGMMLWAVPRFTAIFEELGGPGTELPLMTRVVMAGSKVTLWVTIAVGILAAPGLAWFSRHRRDDKVREVLDPFKLRLPIFGELFRQVAMARFTRNMSTLLGAGVDRIEALTISAETVGNVKLGRAILAARDAQRNGQSLVTPLTREPMFDEMLIGFLEAGEKSGKTSFMLGKAADIYERDVNAATDNMTSLIQPLLFVIIGLIVAVMVFAIFMPYLSLGNLI